MRRPRQLAVLGSIALVLAGCCGDGVHNRHAWLFEADRREGRYEPETCQTLGTWLEAGHAR